MRLNTVSLILPLLLGGLTVMASYQVPPLAGRVVDKANLLSGADRGAVERAIVSFEKATGGQMAVLILKSLDGEPIENVGIKTAEAWKIGRKGKDDGAILVIAVNDRKMRLEIGYGWEGAINDARAGDIVRGMAPYFRKNDFKGGILHAIAGVQRFVTTAEAPEYAPPPASKASNDGPQSPFATLIIVLLVFGVIAFILLAQLISGRGQTYSSRGVRRHSSSYGGFWGGGFGGGGGGFSGGGGSFGGGGASGSW